jgi:DNA-binding HxlR family transcriptional regulator
VKRHGPKSHCPVNVALETVGDPWSLLVIRDIVFAGKHTFGEFMASEERITTSVLADRLAMLVQSGVLAKERHASDRRKECYSLTEKGLDLIPILIELANWGACYDAGAAPDPVWADMFRNDKEDLHGIIRDTVAAGGAVFGGANSLAELASPGAIEHLSCRESQPAPMAEPC